MRKGGRREGAMIGHRTLAAAVGALALVTTGCGNGGGGGGTIDVTLQEFAVIPEEPSVENGKVTFKVSNKGPDDVHEFVVFKTNLSPIDLPTNPDGSVNEEGEGIELIGEIEDIPIGETQSVTVGLESGSYVLICNIYTKSEKESHYQEGMRTSFTVE
jgi:uncharacterized cupredoxin-like copper-binding protein